MRSERAWGSLEVVVDPTGAVESVRLRSPENRYRERWWLFVAKNWQFRPAYKDGQPVRFLTLIPLTDARFTTHNNSLENKFGRAIPVQNRIRPAARNSYTLPSSIEQSGGQDLSNAERSFGESLENSQ